MKPGFTATSRSEAYQFVPADGGIFAFAAPFVGSVPGALPPGTTLAADGGIFTFSSVEFLGSLGNNPPDTPVRGVAAFAS